MKNKLERLSDYCDSKSDILSVALLQIFMIDLVLCQPTRFHFRLDVLQYPTEEVVVDRLEPVQGAALLRHLIIRRLCRRYSAQH